MTIARDTHRQLDQSSTCALSVTDRPIGLWVTLNLTGSSLSVTTRPTGIGVTLMSRGLSEQQRRILGLGVRINRAVNGGKVVPITGRLQEMPGHGLVLCSPGLPEITVRYVLHLLHGVPIAERLERGGGFFAHDAHTRSLKASVTRAVTSLCQRRHIAMTIERGAWPGRQFPRDLSAEEYRRWWDDLPEDERLAAHWGYALLSEGIDVGLENEPTDLALPNVLAGVRRLQHERLVREVLDKRLEAFCQPKGRAKRYRKVYGRPDPTSWVATKAQARDILVDNEKGVPATIVHANIGDIPFLDRVKLTHLAIGHFGGGSFMVEAYWCEMNGDRGRRMQRESRTWSMNQPVLIIEGDDVDLDLRRVAHLAPHSDRAAQIPVWQDIVKQARESGRTILADNVDKALAIGRGTPP
jgi:hypothetical protein